MSNSKAGNVKTHMKRHNRNLFWLMCFICAINLIKRLSMKKTCWLARVIFHPLRYPVQIGARAPCLQKNWWMFANQLSLSVQSHKTDQKLPILWGMLGFWFWCWSCCFSPSDAGLPVRRSEWCWFARRRENFFLHQLAGKASCITFCILLQIISLTISSLRVDQSSSHGSYSMIINIFQIWEEISVLV